MHANNFFSEFLDILKNNFWPVGASTPRSESGFPVNQTATMVDPTVTTLLSHTNLPAISF
jgi:hypothetical protein